MKHSRKEKYINLKPYDMGTDEDYKNVIPKEVRDAYDKAVNNHKVQERINKAKKGGEE